jgi:hypothetical protein
MKLKASLIKKFTEGLDQEYACIYDSYKTRIYDCHRGKMIVVTKERPKYEYYKHALSEGYEHIPKIYDLVEDTIHGIYIIKREELFPITDHKKLVRIDIIKDLLNHGWDTQDRIAKEVRKFYNENQDWVKLDFSPHYLMETKNKKIVVSDIFVEQ